MTADVGRSMRAMLFEGVGSPLRLAEVAVPEPGPGQLLLRVLACGVCRTDLHLLDGEVEIAQPPRVLGHQIVARVEPDGRRVGVPWLGWTCGECAYCRSGRENLCPGRASPAATSTGASPSTPWPTSGSASRSRTASRRPGRSTALRRPHRLPLPAHVRRRPAPRALRLRRGRTHPRPGRARPGPRGLRVHARWRRRRTGVRPRARRDVGRPLGRRTTGAARRRDHLRPRRRRSSRSRCAPSRPAGASCAAAST